MAFTPFSATTLAQRFSTLRPTALENRPLASGWVALRWLSWGLGLALTLGETGPAPVEPATLVLLTASTGLGVAVSALILGRRPRRRWLATLAILDVAMAAGLVRLSGGAESAFLAYTFAPVTAAGWLLGHREGLAAGLLTALVAAPSALAHGPYLAYTFSLGLLGGLAQWQGRHGNLMVIQASLRRRLEAQQARLHQLQDVASLGAGQVVGHLDPSRVCLAAASAARQLLEADRAFVLLADPATGELRLTFDTAGEGPLAWKRFAVPLSGPASQVDDEQQLCQLLAGHGLPASLAVPLRAEGQLLGVLAVTDAAPHERPQADREALRLLGGLAASALAAARGHTERMATRQREELRQAELIESLARLQQTLAEATDQRQVCRRLALGLVAALRVERGGVFLIDGRGESASLVARHGVGWCEESGRLRGVALADNAPLAIRAMRARRLVVCGPDEPQLLLGEEQPPGSGMAAPILAGEELLGALFAEAPEPDRTWREPERRFLRLLALLAGLSLRQTRLHREVDRRAADLQTLAHAARSARSSRELRRALDDILRLAATQPSVLFAGLYLADHPTIRAITRRDARPTDLTADPSDPLLAGALASGEPRWASRPEDVPGAFQRLGRPASVLALPLVAAGQTLGLLLVGWPTGARGAPDDAPRLLRLLADQAALAVSQARLRQRAHALERSTGSLLQVPRLASSSLELRDALRAIAAAAATGVQAERASVYLFDGRQRLTPLAVVGFDSQAEAAFARLPLDVDVNPLVRDLVRQKQPVQAGGQRLSQAGLAEWPLLDATRRLLGIPLVAGEEAVGVLFIHEERARREFSEDEIEWLLAVGRQAALAISNAELRERMHQARSRERLLALVARELTGSHRLEQRLATVLERLAEVLPIRSSSIALLERQELRVVATYGQPSRPAGLASAELPSEAVADWSDEPEPPEARQEAGSGASAAAWSHLAMPLMMHGATLGVLEAESERPGVLGEAELNFLSVVANEVANAVARERAKEEARALLQWRDRARQARDFQESASRLLASAIIRIGATDLLAEVDRDQALHELRQAKELASESLHQVRLSADALGSEPPQTALMAEEQAPPLAEPGT